MGLPALAAGNVEIVLAFPAQAVAVKHVRSTLVLGTLSALRDAGYLADYCAALPVDHREPLVNAVAGTWIPVEAAMSHYRACDSLGLLPDVEAQLGAATFERVRGTLLGTMARVAHGAGVTPWTLLGQLQRFWDRAYDGAGLQVTKLGPKEAVVDLVQCPFADTHYHRNALRGLLRSVVRVFCTQAYVHERRGPRAPGTYALRVQWV